MTTPDALLEDWHTLLPTAPRLGAELVTRYSEPHRHYHDRRHLAEVLRTVDLLAEHADDPRSVRLAAWFHDAVYDPRRADNEAASARLARERLDPSDSTGTTDNTESPDLPAAAVAEVARLVELTATHRPAETDANGAVLCDADLAILASDPARYDAYRADVRAEYRHLDDTAFRHGRHAILRHLLELEPLYRTPTARRDWTDRARDNVKRELAELASMPERHGS